MALKMMLQLPLLVKAVNAEHKAIERLIQKQQFDIIISDNRYGCYNKKAYNVFITHQLNIQTPAHLRWLNPVIRQINKNRTSNFNECWVPDFQNQNNLSGDLSHGNFVSESVFYVGPLSRFYEKTDNRFAGEKDIAPILILISGPEPQRTIFEKLVLSQAGNLKVPTHIVCGRPGNYETYHLNDFIQVYSRLDSGSVYDLMQKAEVVICRSGYTTIMELAATGKHATLIPTPGQTEQEYLAKKFLGEKIYNCQSQNVFNLEKAINDAGNFSGLRIENNFELLHKRLDEILK